MNKDTRAFIAGSPRQVVGATSNGRDFQMDVITGPIGREVVIATAQGATSEEAFDNAHYIMTAINTYGIMQCNAEAKKG